MASTRLQAQRTILNWNARRGLDYQKRPWAYLANTQTAVTFTRAGKAYAVDSNGVTYYPGYYEPRLSSVLANDGNTYVGMLQEPAATNPCLQSSDFGTTWAAVGTPTRSAAAHTASGITLDLIGDNDAAALEGYTQTVTFTGDAVKAIAIVMKAGTSTSTVIRLRDTSAPADRLLALITWAAGVPTVAMTTGTNLLTGLTAKAWPLADGAYVFWFQATSVTAANTNSLQVYPATAAALEVANTGTVYAGGVMAFDAVVPTSHIPTTVATVSRAVETAVIAFPDKIQAMSGLVEFVELGTSLIANAVLMWIGAATDPFIHIRRTADGQYIARIDNDAGATSSATLPAGIVLGDHVRIWWELEMVTSTTMRMNARQSINGAAFGTEVNGTTRDKDATVLSDDLYSIGCLSAGSLYVGPTVHLRHAVALGSVSAETLALS